MVASWFACEVKVKRFSQTTAKAHIQNHFALVHNIERLTLKIDLT